MKITQQPRHRRMRRSLALLLLLLLAGCTWVIEPPDAPITTSPTPISTPLSAALALAPANVEHFAFTDWVELKRLAGVNVTSADSLDARMELMMPLGRQRDAAATIYALTHFAQHAEMWGWDSTDLLWESYFTQDGLLVYVLRFRDDFDFAPVLAHLDAREYTSREVGGATLYHHDMHLGEQWIRSSELAILNIAYFADTKTFVLSSSEAAVTATLDAMRAGATLDTVAGAQAIAASLTNAATVFLAPDGCALVAPPIVGGASPEAVTALQMTLDAAGVIHPYDYFGFGYAVAPVDDVVVPVEDDNPEAITTSGAQGDATLPLGIFVHHYANATAAEADVAARRTLATNGSSLATGSPYADLFEVVDASVVPADEGANLLLRLHALDRPPQLFLDMIYRRDVLFATCGTQ